MSEEKQLKFVRLRSLPDDLVGYVTYKQDYILLETPLRIEIDTIFEEGRQILCMQEYLPQTVIDLKEIEIPTEDILMVTPVREEFIEQYEYVCDFFYNNTSKLRRPPNKERPTEISEEAVEKVVSILDALQSKKDKPVH
jgi:hypothetical protein